MGPQGDYATFKVEPRGVDYVPRALRPLTPRRLAGLWAGASFNLEYVVYGALVVSLGLGFLQAVFVIVLGNLAWVITGLASLQGPAAGTTAFGVGRAVFGPRPNRVLAGLNWLTQVGFETLGLSLVVLGGLALVREAGGHPGRPAKWALVVAAAAVQLVLPLFGHATLTSALRKLGWLFAASFVLLAVLAAPKIHLRGGFHGASWEVMTVAAVVVLSGGAMSWTSDANDYSRYLPAHTRIGPVVAAVALGAGLPVLLAEVLGAAVAAGVPHLGSVSVVAGLPAVFPSWFTIPYLVVVICQLFAINGLDLYSSGVSLQAAGVPLRRAQCVAVDTIICAGLTAWAILSNSFTMLLGDFVQFIMVWLAPWVGVYLVDAALRQRRYDLRSLFAPDGGLYRRRHGVSWPALIAQLAGMLGALSWINTGPFTGPLSRITHGADLSIYVGCGIAGGLYWVLARTMVRREADDSCADEAPDLVGFSHEASS
jgi:NCS1 family nucleobase:cation symporter-1